MYVMRLIERKKLSIPADGSSLYFGILKEKLEELGLRIFKTETKPEPASQHAQSAEKPLMGVVSQL